MSKDTKGKIQLLKRLYLKFLVGYGNKQRYWDSRWRLSLKDEEWLAVDREYLILQLTDLMGKHGCVGLLEVGCGAAELKNIKGYVGLDFSLEAIKRSGLKEAIFADITNHIPLPDKCVDVVFCRAVLLHVSHDKIVKAVGELMRVARKMMVFIEPKYDPLAEFNFHCFNHNLKELTNGFDGEVIFF
jgi:hypothetical protein